MKNDNLNWLFISFLAVILASIAFVIISMTRAEDPINIVFLIIHAVDLIAVSVCWVADIKKRK